MSGKRNVENWIEGYCDYLDNTESPTLFKRWVAISTIASVLRRKCSMKWHMHMDTYPNMYIVLVGPAAIGKGVAMGPAENMLQKCGITLSAQSATRQALIQDMVESTQGLTRGTMLCFESNITIISREFSVFLGHNNVELVSDLTDWYDCKNPWTYQTKGRGKESIKGMYVNLLGATTPSILQKTLTDDAISGGLTSRMILVYADTKSRIVPIPLVDQKKIRLEGMLFADLKRISEIEGEFCIDAGVVDPWVDWYIEQEKNHPFKNDTRLHGYAGRRHLHLLKLLMIVSAARGDSRVITREDFRIATQYLSEVEEVMPNAFRGYGANVLSQYIEIIMQEIRIAQFMYFKELIKRHVNDVTLEDLQKIVQTLEHMGFCKTSRGEHGIMIRYTPEKKGKEE